jgi:hypothetical protein
MDRIGWYRIVTIYDVGREDLAYIAMEGADGPPLDEVLSAAQPIAPDKMFSVLGQSPSARDRASGYQAGQHHDRPPPILVPTSSIFGPHVAISLACGRHETAFGEATPDYSPEVVSIRRLPNSPLTRPSASARQRPPVASAVNYHLPVKQCRSLQVRK